MSVPVLETPRLVLREYRLSDYPRHSAIWAHPRTTRDFGFYQYSEEDCWLRFQRNWGQWAMFGRGLWALEHRQTGAYAGAVGFIDAHRAIDLPYRDLPEAAWLIAPDLHRQGYVSEALAVVFAWADAHMDADRSWAMINPQNEASQRVAARFGFTRAQDGDYKGHPVWTYLRPRGGV